MICLVLFNEEYVEINKRLKNYQIDYVIQIPSAGAGGFKIKVVKSLGRIPKRRFKDIFDLYKYLFGFVKRIDFITVKLNGLPLAPTLLENIYHYFLENNRHYISFSGNGFGLPEFLIEAFSEECLVRLNNIKEPLLDNKNLNGHVLSNSKVYWPKIEEVRYYLINNFDLLYSRPRTINIDTSSKCNLSCTKCLYHSAASPFRVKKNDEVQMEFETFKRVIDKIYDEIGNGVSINPAVRGECLLNKSIIQMLEYAAKKGFDISFFTNGQACTPDVFKTLMKIGVKWINFSVDSIEKVLYEKLHRGGSYMRLMQNIQQAVLIKGHNYFPVIGIHYVEHPENEDTFKDFFSYWAEKVDYIFHSSLCDVRNDFQSYKPPLKLPYRYPCFNLWSHLYIDGRGQIFICGVWNQKGYQKKDFFSDTIYNLWNSDFFNLARHMQFEPMLQRGMELCRKDPSWGSNYSKNYRINNYIIKKSLTGTAYQKIYLNTKFDNYIIRIKNLLNRMGINDRNLRFPAKIYHSILSRTRD